MKHAFGILKVTIVLLCIAVGLQSCSCSDNDNDGNTSAATGTISGIVQDSDGGAPIAGATIEVYDGAELVDTSTTGDDGGYSMEVPAGENYRVDVAASGYESASDTDVDVTEDATTTVNFDLNVSNDQTGTIQGVVRNAVTLSAIAGATIEIYDGVELVDTAITGADGGYSVEVPAGSDYTVSVSSTGFISADYNDVDLAEDETVILESILQIADTYVGNGTIAGTITDAFNGTGLSGVTITLRSGLNSRTGATVTTAATIAGGTYSIADVPTGYYTAELSRSGYITAFISVYSLGGETTGNQNASISPELSAGTMRIVLTWGATPTDLEALLTGPTTSGPRFLVTWTNLTVNDGTVATRDVDDVNGYGPETITITTQIAGVYRFYVWNWTNRASNPSSALSNVSGAQVKVYNSSGLVATFNVPANQEGTIWDVFEWSGSTITPLNTFRYANPDDGDVLP